MRFEMQEAEEQIQALCIERMEAEADGHEFSNELLKPSASIILELQNNMKVSMQHKNTQRKGYIIWLKSLDLKIIIPSIKIQILKNSDEISARQKQAAKRLDAKTESRINKDLFEKSQFDIPGLSRIERDYLDILVDDPTTFRSGLIESMSVKIWHPLDLSQIENPVSYFI